MKLPNPIKLSILFLLGMSFNSINAEAQETKNVSVSNFSSVSASTGIDVYLKQGSVEGAKIVANEGVIDEVEVLTRGNELVIRFRENTSFMRKWKNRNAKVYVTYKVLNGVSASSGSSITTENTLKTDRLAAKASSGADLTLDVICKDLQLQTSSGSSASLKGTATNADMRSSSGSDIKALDLVTDYASIKSSSGADIGLTVNKGLETSSSSGSSIRYKGKAALNNLSSSKSSDVRRID